MKPEDIKPGMRVVTTDGTRVNVFGDFGQRMFWVRNDEGVGWREWASNLRSLPDHYDDNPWDTHETRHGALVP